ncbi:MAG: CapA family protein, partial [Saprospiraceae bacterium]|nr:CapA family protein [Saprospiraceae bacterium]
MIAVRLKSIKRGFREGSLFFLGFFGLGLSAFRCADTPTEVNEPLSMTMIMDTIPAESLDTLPDTVTVIGVGDMMLGTNYPSSSYLPPQGGRTMLADVKMILQDADVTFGNLEGTILNSGGTPKRCSNPAACYVFRSPEDYGAHFAEAGFDLLSLANNHSGDMGAAGRSKTKEILDELGIAYAGLAGTDETAIFE